MIQILDGDFRISMPAEENWELVQKLMKLCLGNRVENMTSSQDITSPLKVLKRNVVLKNIEGQMGESREQKLSLLSLGWRRG